MFCFIHLLNIPVFGKVNVMHACHEIFKTICYCLFAPCPPLYHTAAVPHPRTFEPSFFSHQTIIVTSPAPIHFRLPFECLTWNDFLSYFPFNIFTCNIVSLNLFLSCSFCENYTNVIQKCLFHHQTSYPPCLLSDVLNFCILLTISGVCLNIYICDIYFFSTSCILPESFSSLCTVSHTKFVETRKF